MKVTIVYDITNCTDCPFRYAHRGHGEAWYECIHKDHGRPAYANILYGLNEEFKSVPNWCPLKLNELKDNK